MFITLKVLYYKKIKTIINVIVNVQICVSEKYPHLRIYIAVEFSGVKFSCV